MKRAFVWTLPAALLFLGVPVCAKVVYVDSYAPLSPQDGASWNTACKTIAAGLNAAASGDEVWVAHETYTETVTPPAGVSLYGGFAGTETQRSQRDWLGYPTVLDGNGTANAVVTCSHTGIVLDGFAVQSGGTGVNVTGGTATLANNTISGNGNGVAVSGSGTATLVSNLVSSNATGVYASGKATLSNNTVAGNSNTGVSVPGSAALTNNIIAFNGANGVYKPSAGAISTFSDNDVYRNTQGNYSGYTPPAGQGNLSVDPLFANRTNGDYHLADGSTCIDAGDDSAVTAGETDLGGRPRILGAHVDIGAYEYGLRVIHVSKAGNDSHDGLTWATAKRTVGAALALARGLDEVWVVRGTYKENIAPLGGVSLYGGFAGTEAERSERRLSTITPTTLDGNGTTQAVVTCSVAGIIVDGFTVQNGSTGVNVSGGAATLAHNTISGNKNDGVYVDNGTASLANNTISANLGYGVDVEDTANLSNNTVSGNAKDGVYVTGGEAFLTGNTLSNNSGNGLSVSYGSVTITGNTVSTNAGDGVSAEGTNDAILTGNAISANTGNGVYVAGNGEATLTNNVVFGNHEDGVEVLGEAAMANNTLSGNAKDGVYVSDQTNSLNNNIVAFNGVYGVHKDNSDAITAFSHNDVYGNTGGNYASGYTPPAGQGNLSSDPLFWNRANNVYWLAARSPCINAGDDTVVTAGETDNDGNPRILGVHVDIGAYEFVPFSIGSVKQALGIAGGTIQAATVDVARINVEGSGTAINLLDAVRLARKAAGVDPNP